MLQPILRARLSYQASVTQWGCAGAVAAKRMFGLMRLDTDRRRHYPSAWSMRRSGIVNRSSTFGSASSPSSPDTA